MTLLDLNIIVNDTVAGRSQHAGFSDRLADSSLLSDERFFVIFGVVGGVLVVCVFACVVCALMVLRRKAAKPSHLKPSADQHHKDCSSTPVYRRSLNGDSCATSSDQHSQHWNDEYTKMINVRNIMTLILQTTLVYTIVHCYYHS